MDFHKKFAKIEVFKVDYSEYSKKATKTIDNHQNPLNLL